MHCPRIFCALSLAAALIAVPCMAQVTRGKTTDKVQYGDWEAFGLANKTEARIRMDAPSRTGDSLLIIDAYVPRCQLDLLVGFPHSSPQEKDVGPLRIPLVIRVDDGDPYYLEGVYSATMGDTAGFLLLAATPSFRQLLGDLGKGRFVRLKLEPSEGGNKRAVTETYSLRGFAESLLWTRATCDAVVNAQRSGQNSRSPGGGAESKPPKPAPPAPKQAPQPRPPGTQFL
ncbi:hypothetical protein BOBR111200_07265 [Bordetella bronchialis]